MKGPSYLRAIVSTVAFVSAACRGGTSIPTAPTLQPPPAVIYTLSGVISEVTPAGELPIAGARVVESSTGRAALTDGNGSYSIPGLTARTYSLSVSAPGYVNNIASAAVAGDTRLDIRIVRIVTYTISGVVYEVTGAGTVPVEGVEIYCDSCGSPTGHTFVYTDASGSYRLPWSANGIHPLFVTKAGYEIVYPPGTSPDAFGRISAMVNAADTRFDVRLARR